ncbi:unnamed protein product [Heligmosomoides polygyrus]|uniref:Reverse transcriptase domain-containing protein n=1 Tax=Heligmosomoides polygyrus TaxID=6339 RepID=A0A183F275_HELPZ|nr:unnamed protein product [Heligmosomoides polygyrus]
MDSPAPALSGRAATEEDLKKRGAEVLAEAAKAWLSIRNARRNIANFKTKMTALRRPDGTVASSERAWRRSSTTSTPISSIATSTCPHAIFRGWIRRSLCSPFRDHAISSVKKRTAPGPDRIRPEHLKNLTPTLINTLARLFMRSLSEYKVLPQWKTSKTVFVYKKGDVHIGNYRPLSLLSVAYKL